MNASLMLMIGGGVTIVVFFIVFLMGLRIIPGGLLWHKRLGIVAMVLAILHGLGAILNFLGFLPF